MPRAPERGDVGLEVRPPEVLGHLEAEQARRADRDVGVAREVEVDAQRVGDERDDDLEREAPISASVLASGVIHSVSVSASTTFLASPTRMRVVPSATSSALVRASRTCAEKPWKRLMGPATIVGMKSAKPRKSSGACSGSDPRARVDEVVDELEGEERDREREPHVLEGRQAARTEPARRSRSAAPRTCRTTSTPRVSDEPDGEGEGARASHAGARRVPSAYTSSVSASRMPTNAGEKYA